MGEPNIDTILNDIKYYVTRKVDNFQSSICDLNKDADKFQIVQEWLDCSLDEVSESIDYLQNDGLSINAVEMEGYKRALIELSSIIKDID